MGASNAGSPIGAGHHHKSRGSSVRPLADDAVFSLWCSRHPNATSSEINAEMRRRMLELRDRERVQNLALMRKYYQEIEALETPAAHSALSTTDAADGANEPLGDEQCSTVASADLGDRTPLPDSIAPNSIKLPPATLLSKPQLSPRPPAARRCQLPAVDSAEYDKQRLTWLLLVAKPETDGSQGSLPQTQSSISHGDASLMASVRRDEPFSGYDDIGTWVQRHWRHATHRHEAAATRIQCALRRLFAVKRTHRLRLRRKAMVEAVLQSEAPYEDAWVIAVATREQSAKEAAATEKRVRILRGFLKRVRAWMDRRRRARQMGRRLYDETAHYAATRIQALVRGIQERQRLYLERHPEIQERRQREYLSGVATTIQRYVKSFVVRRRIARQHAAAIVIQKHYRRHLAEALATSCRWSKHRADTKVVHNFSAGVLQRFFARLVATRRLRLRGFKSEARLLQRVGRGYAARHGTMSRIRNAEQHRAAMRIQTVTRQRQARKRVQRRRDEIQAELQVTQREHAARIITRAMRRAWRQKKLARQVNMEDAAREIQRVYRGHRGRAERQARLDDAANSSFSVLRREAAIIIQALVRGFIIRRRLVPKNSDDKSGAAMVIQRMYRSRIRAPRMAAAVDKAARAVTCFMRCVPAMRRVKAMLTDIARWVSDQAASHAAVLIQLWTRVMLARTRTNLLRQERLTHFRSVRQSEAVQVLARFFRRLVARSKGLRRRAALARQTNEL
jgi:hypothetical protein